MALTVNLDALILREDFAVEVDTRVSQPVSTMQIRDLEDKAFIYNVLRKPDFQRETSEWTPKKIYEFVKSFLSGDLIPALILWRSGSYIFVIDGAHRLSALIAWVRDDYGDGALSQIFFQGRIPDEQLEAATKTRNFINKKLHSYSEHQFGSSNPDKVDAEVAERAKLLATLALQLQWVNGDANKAEESFFKINQEATPINKTEIKLLQSRKKPNALSARAIIRSGTGHKYWSDFESTLKKEIERIAQDINDILFKPPLKTPIKTLDVPIAGQAYSVKSLPLVFDLVNLTNEHLQKEMDKNDLDGATTITFLKNTRSIVYRISGNHPSSLGLHPVVYFYSHTGRYQPYSFLAIVQLIKDLEKTRKFDVFTKCRSKFEEFLLTYRDIQNQIAVKYTAGRKGINHLCKFYLNLINFIDSGLDNGKIIKKFNGLSEFNFVKFSVPVAIDFETGHKDFTSEIKSSAFLKEAMLNFLKCSICNGILHSNSISYDHIERKQDGGVGNLENAQLTHPFCNTTFKN